MPRDPLVYGGVDLGEDEADVLLMHPKMRLLEPLQEGHMEHQLEKCLTTVRYDRKRTDSAQNRNQLPHFTHSNLPFKCEDPDNPHLPSTSVTLKFSSMRVTDLPTNREVKLPEVIDTSEETKLLAFKTEVMQLTKDYIAQNCDEQGRQQPNIGPSQCRGISRLKSRCAEEDLVIKDTDKSKRLSIMTKENYILSTDPHTANDRTISDVNY